MKNPFAPIQLVDVPLVFAGFVKFMGENLLDVRRLESDLVALSSWG